MKEVVKVLISQITVWCYFKTMVGIDMQVLLYPVIKNYSFWNPDMRISRTLKNTYLINFGRMRKGAGLKFSVIKCKFWLYDNNISPKLKKISFVIFMGIFFFWNKFCRYRPEVCPEIENINFNIGQLSAVFQSPCLYRWPNWQLKNLSKLTPFARGPWNSPHKFHLYLIYL